MQDVPTEPAQRLVLAITCASGALYAQRLIDVLAEGGHEVHVVFSAYAKQVAQAELEAGIVIPPTSATTFLLHGDKSMNVPFASGSALFDAMIIAPASMGTLGRIAHGYAETTITRAADVFLKEKRPLILVPRETPWNLIHARNVVTLLEAGATLIPAMPSFYHRPVTLTEAVDTVIARVLDHLEISHHLIQRWREPAPPE
jgi:flavin prenyltransferase